VIDALWHLGVRDIGLPLTSERVWRALAEARAGAQTRESHERQAV